MDLIGQHDKVRSWRWGRLTLVQSSMSKPSSYSSSMDKLCRPWNLPQNASNECCENGVEESIVLTKGGSNCKKALHTIRLVATSLSGR